ncbi:tetratricopeptide repeat protein [Streptomyces sp. NPDC001717]|uniref:tetratricopeptide repeat protein n=1 Tax=Streptomyces sp. NPDC001717 TaxID=3364604 RepID=UPI00369F952D
MDDEIHDALEAMEAISSRLGRQGHPLKKFDKQLITYRQRRHQAENEGPSQQPGPGEPGSVDPAPASPSSTVLAQVGLVGLGMLPGVGAFTGAVDPRQVALGADRMRAILNTRLRSHDDVQLVMRPLEKLTPVFLEDLAEVAAHCERVVLFFDVFERTGPILDAWLQDIIFGENHCGLPVNVQIVLSGRLRLDPRNWGDRLGQVTEVGLEVFTDDEARALLATQGVTDEPSVEMVLRLSGRLPLLVDMLARSSPGTAASIGDPSETAVERFLKWEQDASRREVALICALPLQLNEDIYRACVPPAAADDYAWLRSLAFISHQAGRCRYHDVVRSSMLRLRRTQSPSQWQEAHIRLSDTFREWRLAAEASLGEDPDEYWEDFTWREQRLNETYHRLCAHPKSALLDAVRQAINAIDHDVAILRRWAQTITQAGRDTEDGTLISFGERLEAAGEQDSPAIAVLTLLIGTPSLDAPSRALAYTVRAREHREAADYESALADYAAAFKAAPATARCHAGRGETYRLMGQYDRALADLNLGIALDARADWAVYSRAETYQAMERYEEAIADYTSLIESDPQDFWSVAGRGAVYRITDRYEEALADFKQALQLNPQSSWCVISRAYTLQFMGRYEEALADFDQALQVAPQSAWATAGRALTHRLKGSYEEALLDYNRLVELDRESDWAVAGRALTYQLMGRYDEALTDFNHALRLNPEADQAFAGRGRTFQLMGRYSDALTDYNAAVQIDPDDDRSFVGRGNVYRTMGRYHDALSDFSRAVELDPDDSQAVVERAQTYQAMGRNHDAISDYDHALQLDPRSPWVFALRGETYRSMGRYDDAIADFSRAIELSPEYGWALDGRAETYLLMGRVENALLDSSAAIRLTPEEVGHHFVHGIALRMAGSSEADAHFQRAIQLLSSEVPRDDYAAIFPNAGLLLVHCAIPDWANAATQLQGLIEQSPPPHLIHEVLDTLSMLKQICPETASVIGSHMERLREFMITRTSEFAA